MSATQHKTYFINRKERNGIQYHHGLGEGFFHDNLTISRSFPAYGKMLAKQFHFYSGPSSMLRFSSYIAMQFINLNADLWEKSFFVIFLVRLELRRIIVLVRGLGVSLSLFSQWACSTLVCGGCLRDFSPRQVLGYLYCGIFAIRASAFRDISTLYEGCWKSSVTIPIIHVRKECCYTPPDLRRCNSTKNVWDIGIPQTAVFCFRGHLRCLRMDY